MAKKEERYVEFLRRSKLLQRKQIELLHEEGSISKDNFELIVAYNSSSISKEKLEINTPKKNPNFSPEDVTIEEISEGLIGGLIKEIGDTEKIEKELDPFNFDWFEKQDYAHLMQDLLIGTLAIRNLSLKNCYSNEIAKIIEKKCCDIVLGGYGSESLDLYYSLKKTWYKSLEKIHLPQIEISKTIRERSNNRFEQKEESSIEWVKEIAIAEVLVNTYWYYWNKVSMLTKLKNI